jgi:streptomycin 6-kinase
VPRSPVTLPRGLEWWRDEPGGGDWLERLPQLVAECVEEWKLTLGAPFEPAHISYVAGVELPDGTPAVLKLNFPEPESEHEAHALAHWEGDGAVLLFAHDPERRALVIERCEPGTQLWAVEDEEEANRIAASVLTRLWRSPPPEHGFRLLADEAARWAEELPAAWCRLGRPYERHLLDEAVTFLEEAGPTQGEAVVVHQDFHGGNVLSAEREPWLAIDPKPLVGEREFDVASLLRDRRQELSHDPGPARTIRRRLDQLASELKLDRERMRGWGIAHALAWDSDEWMIACARWLAAA